MKGTFETLEESVIYNRSKDSTPTLSRVIFQISVNLTYGRKNPKSKH